LTLERDGREDLIKCTLAIGGNNDATTVGEVIVVPNLASRIVRQIRIAGVNEDLVDLGRDQFAKSAVNHVLKVNQWSMPPTMSTTKVVKAT
jgi:hypothetical protein